MKDPIQQDVGSRRIRYQRVANSVGIRCRMQAKKTEIHACESPSVMRTQPQCERPLPFAELLGDRTYNKPASSRMDSVISRAFFPNAPSLACKLVAKT